VRSRLGKGPYLSGASSLGIALRIFLLLLRRNAWRHRKSTRRSTQRLCYF